MNLRVTILTAAPNQPGVRGAAGGQEAAGDQLVHMATHAVALLAQQRPGRDQQLFMVRAMRVMAAEAVFAGGGMLEQKWPTLFCMTTIAGFIDRWCTQQRTKGRPMRVMAVKATDFAFEKWHMGAATEVDAGFPVTHHACVIDTPARQQALAGDCCHGVVTVAAGEVGTVMDGGVPVQTLAAFMAGHALSVLHLDAVFACA